jgi:DNA-directed RNA polymerase subunit RPC12/RpoP
MAYYVIFYAYYCKECKKGFYIVNAKFPSKREPKCQECGRRMKFMGRVRALLDNFEEYKRIVEQRIFDELPVGERRPRELPHIMLRFKPWASRTKRQLLKAIGVSGEVVKAWRR